MILSFLYNRHAILVEIGAVLSHVTRSLSKAEQSYVQINIQALATMRGVKNQLSVRQEFYIT